MNLERQQEVKEEAKRRLNQWIENSTIDEMTVSGSRIRFDMSIGLFGYPFEKENWMVGFDAFVNQDEFDSNEYDEIIDELYHSAMEIMQKEKK